MRSNKLLEQFRSFYFRNYPNDMETQIEYFSLFGGLGWQIDTTRPPLFIIEELVLKNYEAINNKILKLTLHDRNNIRLLRALAIGDRRIFSAFKRAGLNNGNGGAALNYLNEKGLVNIEYSREEPAKSLNPNKKLKRSIARHRISHKVLFSQPFIRFWFYFITPFAREIKAGEFQKFKKNFLQKKNSYTSLVFEEISEVLLNYHIRDSQILSSGSYWDANVEIDILTVTDKEEVYVAECKWTNHIINKKEFHKLKEKCDNLNIEPTQIVFFSKRGFSKELESLQSRKLALYSCEDFQALVKNISRNDLISEYFIEEKITT